MPIQIHFPAVAVSPAGWVKAAHSLDELTDASPRDDLRQWQGLGVFDAGGNAFRTNKVVRRWPVGRLGLALCWITNQSVHVELELQPEATVSVLELAAMLNISDALPLGNVWSSQRELVEFACG
jgi:hypothetical protein